MKRMLLFIATSLMMITTAQANEIDLKESNDFKMNQTIYRNVQPVLFTYNNVDYAIFPDGRIEFEVPQGNTRSNYYRRSTSRRYTTYSTSLLNNRRQFVRYNRRGQVVKIGNTRLFYNRLGAIQKVGTLNVGYAYGVVNRVGGLEVLYNRRGRLIAARGHVLVRNFYGHGHDCNDHNFGEFIDDHQDWDDGIYFKRKATK
ncbi:hypothetical protein LX97_01733 [Nonlabens dokdonensis]|uniref:Uncharacterized protein n=2 Tax=Nonlabens dokdonensis TaxID=328515 RepID=L7WBZ9_NONDD|nr:hypothetical protein [Nonlabens dokdonensis]AGC77436.1 hypothetical protein DDD_2309 [Nonlabens dokdonensis DSW-6]PZX40960.1 hypothetical protein LX97_01733 [Nonlabens dokdonensis]